MLSPSYKFTDDLTGYVSWQYGEKAGISQTTNGISNLVDGEENSAYEIGVKGVFLDGNFTLNTDYFYSTIDNYQQGVRIVDEYTTALNAAAGLTEIAYTTATGNVPRVRAQGVELDSVYSGIPNTQLRFSLAYTDAYYVSFPNSAQPNENGYAGAPAYRDASGETLPGSFEYSFNLGVDFRLPVCELARVPHPARTLRIRASSTATSHCRVMRGSRRARSSIWRWVSVPAAAASM